MRNNYYNFNNFFLLQLLFVIIIAEMINKKYILYRGTYILLRPNFDEKQNCFIDFKKYKQIILIIT